MSETTQDKTKRKLLHALHTYPWSYQYSIFFDESEDSIYLLDELPIFKKALRRVFPAEAMLLHVRLLKASNHPIPRKTQAYVSIFTLNKLDATRLNSIMEKCISDQTRLLCRKISPSKLNRTINSIQKQSLHNLVKFFGEKKVNRYALLNKAYLPT